eukprot:scaffold106236_cov29-Tisochrysis_lutea.AAC.1
MENAHAILILGKYPMACVRKVRALQSSPRRVERWYFADATANAGSSAYASTSPSCVPTSISCAEMQALDIAAVADASRHVGVPSSRRHKTRSPDTPPTINSMDSGEMSVVRIPPRMAIVCKWRPNKRTRGCVLSSLCGGAPARSHTVPGRHQSLPNQRRGKGSRGRKKGAGRGRGGGGRAWRAAGGFSSKLIKVEALQSACAIACGLRALAHLCGSAARCRWPTDPPSGCAMERTRAPL